MPNVTAQCWTYYRFNHWFDQTLLTFFFAHRLLVIAFAVTVEMIMIVEQHSSADPVVGLAGDYDSAVAIIRQRVRNRVERVVESTSQASQ